MILYSLIGWLLVAAHPFHVAVCEINHNSSSQKLEITQKVFIDDLETAVNKAYDVKLLLGNPKQHASAKELIGRYATERFNVVSDNKKMELAYLGFELESDQAFLYFESKKIKKPAELRITFTVLLEQFADQSNLVHLKGWGDRKTLYLSGKKGADNWILP
ncbi:MAG TPA: DUF6702 family protein [Luteibaculaceae bacterium]|nr:DUF6702 family protein [Luteibaculaceae bacterium]